MRKEDREREGICKKREIMIVTFGEEENNAGCSIRLKWRGALN